MKFRIKRRGNYYYPQFKRFIFWSDFFDTNYSGLIRYPSFRLTSKDAADELLAELKLVEANPND